MKHIKTVNKAMLNKTLKTGGCGECPASCQSALQARKHEYYSDESRVCQGFLLGIPAQRFPLRGDGFHYTPSLLRRMISASSGVVVEV